MTDAPPTPAADGERPLSPVSLPELARTGGSQRWRLAQKLAGLDQAEAVRGELWLRHLGDGLEVGAAVHTRLHLCCDRCLQSFPQPLEAEVQERIPFTEATALSPLDEPLDPAGRFDPEHWLFEQLSLRLPQVTRCGPACPGPATWSSEAARSDPRWAALAALQPPEPTNPSLQAQEPHEAG